MANDARESLDLLADFPLTFRGTLYLARTLLPAATDGAALGSTALMFSDLFLASGAVINFNASDVTITHTTNVLSFAGGTYNFDGAVGPSADNAAALGASGTAWADLFLASGGIIDWAGGDVTLTHASNSLTFGGGDFKAAAGFHIILTDTSEIQGAAATDNLLWNSGSFDINSRAGQRFNIDTDNGSTDEFGWYHGAESGAGTKIAALTDLKEFQLSNGGTEPTSATANTTGIYSVDIGAATVLGVVAETAAVTTNDFAMTTKIIIRYNNASYALAASTTLTAV